MLKIMAIGIGDFITDVMNSLYLQNKKGIELALISENKLELEKTDISNKIFLKKGIYCFTPSYVPEMGEIWIKENKEIICEYLKDIDYLMIITNVTGELGSIGSSELAKIAKEMDIFTISIALKPFKFEGGRRLKHFYQYLPRLKQCSDCTLVISSDEILSKYQQKLSIKQMAQVILPDYISAIIYPISDNIHNYQLKNINPCDFIKIFSKNSYAVSGQGVAIGENASEIVVNHALQDNLFRSLVIQAVKHCSVYVSFKQNKQYLGKLNKIYQKIDNYFQGNQDICIDYSVSSSENQQFDVQVVLFATMMEDYNIEF